MTSLSRYLVRMIIFLAVIGAGIRALYEPLERAFMGNPVINSIILAALLIGILFAFGQILNLMSERRWVLAATSPKSKKKPLPQPALLATVAVFLRGRSGMVSAQSLRSVTDGLAIRLDENRETSRYMIGLLVFLGLLGTFWGLLTTVQAVGDVVKAIDPSSTDVSQMMSHLKRGLEAPIGGMATAFSSSLFGLGGSLILGFLDLQLGQASGRFYNDVEDWLSKSIHFTNVDDEATYPAMTPGLSEAAADKLRTLARAVEKNESDNRELAASIRELTLSLSKTTQTREDAAMAAKKIDALESTITREMRAERKEISSTISKELRVLLKTLTKLMKG